MLRKNTEITSQTVLNFLKEENRDYKDSTKERLYASIRNLIDNDKIMYPSKGMFRVFT